MLYCAKCRGVCPDSTAKCPNCKNTKLRQVEGEDLVRLRRVDQYSATLLEKALAQQGIPCRLEPFTGGWVSYLYDNDVLPTDKLALVPWAHYEAAKAVDGQVAKQVEEERAAVGGGETFEDMPQGKRILVQVVSVAAFIVAIMLVVFGTDAFAGWLKGLFS